MPPNGTSKREFSPRALVIVGLAVTVLLAGVVALLAPKEPSGARRAVEAKLAELRAKGFPVTEEEIGRALPDPPPERDARLLLREAFNLRRPEDIPNFPTLPIIMDGPIPARRKPIPAATMADLERFLSNSDQVLAAVPRDLVGARFSMGWTNRLTNVPTLPGTEMRAILHCLALKALYEAERGNAARSSEALCKGFAAGRVFNGDTLVNAMIRVACARIVCAGAEQALNRVRFTSEELRQIDMEVKPDEIDDFRHTFMVERHFGVLTFKDMQHSTRGLRGIAANIVLRFQGRRSLYRDEDFLSFLNFNEQQIQMHSLPLLERVRGYERLTSNYAVNARSLTSEMVMPDWSKAMRTAAETKARLVALKAALAIERFRLANNNRLPATLDALVPDYCSSAPRDPFDEQPLRYKKLGRGYVVYSIGADGVDNGGAERTNPKNMSDYDVMITVER
jgi:hypothetical protein